MYLLDNGRTKKVIQNVICQFTKNRMAEVGGEDRPYESGLKDKQNELLLPLLSQSILAFFCWVDGKADYMNISSKSSKMSYCSPYYINSLTRSMLFRS